MSGRGDSPWEPTFEGQRPPFPTGNDLAVTHGAYSPRKVAPLATELVEMTLADQSVAFLRAPRYAAALWAWARAEARVQLLDEWVNAMPIERASMPAKPGAAPPVELLRRWEATAQTHRSRLGLDPVSAARLSKDLAQTRQAVDTASVMAELHAMQMRGEAIPGEGVTP